MPKSARRGAVVLSLAAAGAMFAAAPVASAAPPERTLEHVWSGPGFTGGHVAVEGKRMYVGAYGAGMRIFDVSNLTVPVELGKIVPGGARADAVPDAIDYGNRSFAVLNGTGRTSGKTHVSTQRSEFFDVTDPEAPKLLAHFVGPTDGEAHNGDIVDKRRLWLPSGGRGADGLRIYDLTPTLTTKASDCVVAERDSGDASNGGGNPCAPRKVYGSKAKSAGDAVDQGNPTLLWENSPYRNDRPVGAPFTHTHDITVYPDHPVRRNGRVERRDIALLAEGGAYANNAGNTGSVFVIDITDPRDPVVLLRWLHAVGDGHHPIRYHHEAQLLDGDRSVMLVTDEDLHNGCGNAGGVTAVRLSPDLTTATELSEWFIPSGTPAPVCSVHVLSSQGRYVFLGSYNAGLQVVDYGKPAQPRQVAAGMQPGTTAWGALYHRGYVYVGDVTRGIDVFKWGKQHPGGGPKRASAPSAFGPATSLGRLPVLHHHFGEHVH